MGLTKKQESYLNTLFETGVAPLVEHIDYKIIEGIYNNHKHIFETKDNPKKGFYGIYRRRVTALLRQKEEKGIGAASKCIHVYLRNTN